MDNLMVKTFLLGVFSLALFACGEDGPTGDSPSEKFPGNWGICFDSVKCESVLDDGVRISADSISKVELSGFENTEFQSAECAKCAKRIFTSWKYETVTIDDYSLQGDSLSFSTVLGEDVTIRLLKSGRIVKASVHIKGRDVDTLSIQHWTRLSGTFTKLD
jgi:hypothetical protein